MTFLLLIIAAALYLLLGGVYLTKKKKGDAPLPTLEDLIDANGEPNDYQIVLATCQHTFHLPVGRDAGWAQDVTVRLKEELSTANDA